MIIDILFDTYTPDDFTNKKYIIFIFIDPSFSLGKMVQEENYYSEEELELLSEKNFIEIVKAFGSDKVLFGSDSPWSDQKLSVDAINSLPLTDSDKKKIFSQNALNILNIAEN